MWPWVKTHPPNQVLAGTLREVASCDVISPWDVMNGESERLHSQVTASDSSITVLHSLQPLKNFTVSLQGEFAAKEVVSEGVKGPLNS